METVYREISLELFKSRLPGLLPYVGESAMTCSGNYGQIVYDIDFSKLSSDSKYSSLSSFGIMSYRAMMDNYYWINRYFQKCSYYQTITKNGNIKFSLLKAYTEGETHNATIINEDLQEILFTLGYVVDSVSFVEDLSDATTDCEIVGVMENSDETEYTYDNFIDRGGLLFYQFVNDAIGKIVIPDTIQGCLVPNFIYLQDIDAFISQMQYIKTHYECNPNEYYDRGGDEIIAYLSQFTGTYRDNKIAYFSNLSVRNSGGAIITLSITQDYDEMGLYRLYDTDWTAGYTYLSGETVTHDEETYVRQAASAITLSFNDNEWNKCTTTGISFNEIVYSGESQLQDLRDIRKSYDDNGNELFGILNYSGSTLRGITFPYEENCVRDTYAIGDDTYGSSIYDIEKDTDAQTYTFRYVIGGLLKEGTTEGGLVYDIDSETGIRYEETYPYVTSSITTTIDDEEVTLTEDIIDFDSFIETIDSIGTSAILSEMRHNANRIFGKERYKSENVTYETENMLYSPIYRDERDFGLSDKRVWRSTVNVDRSSNAAFEKHFKLMEVNTFDDLENYGNNYFNIEEE